MTGRFHLSARMGAEYVRAMVAHSNARSRGYFPLHVRQVPALRRASLDLGAHGFVRFAVASDPLDAWVHCLPSPRFVWRAVTSHAEYRWHAGGDYAPMNCYRDRGDRVLRRVALIVEGAR